LSLFEESDLKLIAALFGSEHAQLADMDESSNGQN
jgi:hypothetical protein